MKRAGAQERQPGQLGRLNKHWGLASTEELLLILLDLIIALGWV